MSEEEKKSEGENLVVLTGSVIVDPVWSAEDESAATVVRAQVLVLRDQMLSSFFDMGRHLYRIRNAGYWRRWINETTGKKFESFDKYVEDEVKFASRSAGYYMNVWLWYSQLPNYEELKPRIAHIGWAKAKTLIGIAGKDTVDEWLTKAETIPLRDLEVEARIAMDRAGMKRRPVIGGTGPTDVRHDQAAAEAALKQTDQEVAEKLNDPSNADASGAVDVGTGLKYPGYAPNTDGKNQAARKKLAADNQVVAIIGHQDGLAPLTGDQKEDQAYRLTFIIRGEDVYENVKQSLEKVKEMAESQSDAQWVGLDYLCTHFLSFYNAAIGENKRKRWVAFHGALAKAWERNFGLNIVILKPGTNHVMYGRRHLEKLESFYFPGPDEGSHDPPQDEEESEDGNQS